MPEIKDSVDVILLGQGVHGLVAANLLAREGVSVLVCDPVPAQGAQDDITDDSMVDACAHFPLCLSADTARVLEIEGQDFFQPEIIGRIRKIAGLLFGLSARVPAYDEKGWRDLWSVFETGKVLADQSDQDQALFADLMKLSAVDFAEKHANDTLEQGVLCAMAVMGYDHGPTRQGSAAGLVGAALQPEGTITLSGSLSRIMAHLRDRALDYGVRFESERMVTSLVMEGNRATGVTLNDDRRVDARVVLSDMNPLHLFEDLCAQSDLPDLFHRRLNAMQRRSRAVRMTMCVEGKPVFSHLPADGHDAIAASGFVYAPDPQYCVAADREARSDGGASHPILSVIVPTLSNPALAPAGQHTISVLAQYFDPSLPAEEDNQQSVLDACVLALEKICPDIAQNVLGARVFMGPVLDRTIGPFNRSEQLSAQPVIQILASLSGHHALGFDQPIDRLMLVGYGAEAAGAPHLAANGTRAAAAIMALLGRG